MGVDGLRDMSFDIRLFFFGLDASVVPTEFIERLSKDGEGAVHVRLGEAFCEWPTPQSRNFLQIIHVMGRRPLSLLKTGTWRG